MMNRTSKRLQRLHDRRWRFLKRALFDQRSMIFKPTSREVGTPTDVGLEHEAARLPVRSRLGSPGFEIRSWWIPADPVADRASGRKAVLFLPGRVGNLGYHLTSLRFLNRLGADVLAIDYPGYGPSTGQPSERSCHSAAKAGWRELTDRRGFSPDQIVIYGCSLGATVAMWLAARVDSAGVVFHSGFSSIPQLVVHHLPPANRRLGQLLSAVLCRTRLDAEAQAKSCRAPVLAIHHRQDSLVPAELGRRVYERVRTPKQWLLLDGEHNDSLWTRDIEVQSAWRELLDGQGWAAR